MQTILNTLFLNFAITTEIDNLSADNLVFAAFNKSLKILACFQTFSVQLINKIYYNRISVYITRILIPLLNHRSTLWNFQSSIRIIECY